MSHQSCVLYQNPPATITLIDIPRSIELEQGEISRQLISLGPLESPFPSLRPKSTKALSKLRDTSLDDLLIQKFLELSLEELRTAYEGVWCLPRTAEVRDDELEGSVRSKWKAGTSSPGNGNDADESLSERDYCVAGFNGLGNGIFYHNHLSSAVTTKLGTSNHEFWIPPRATIVQGDIASSFSFFMREAPDFDAVILDPPWPNRSARRKKSYGTPYGSVDTEALLRSIPIGSKVLDGGFVGIWITNKPIFRHLVLRDGGIFDEWDVTPVEEWLWVKVTKSGVPVYPLDSAWRKPYETLLVARKGRKEESEIKRRVIVGVPDLHSRKPNMKCLLETMMGKKEGKYQGLEVFARNLTSGWWCWGNEVLKFQSEEYWTSRDALQ